ncbi:MAG: hypothetical protein ACHQRM_05265 [Bacteroidia bacterium]
MKFKFHLVPASHPLLRYQHEYVSLCEGLRELGREFYGSDTYWQEPDNNHFLITKAPASFESDVDVYNTYFFAAFPEAILHVNYDKMNILIDREDGLYGAYSHPMFKKFDLILRTHYNGHVNYAYYHPNIKPWAFGLSERIMKTTNRSFGEPVADRMLVNFRLPHQLRDKAAKEFIPVIADKYPVFNGVTRAIEDAVPDSASDYDRINWKQSGHRHDPEYYRLLNTSLLTSAFGGFIFPRPFATNRMVRQAQNGVRLWSSLSAKLGLDIAPLNFIDQFDSWRLWESFYSQTCPVHMDFDYWKWVLPVMPVNKQHYWGVKGFEFEKSAAALKGLHRDDILQIGLQGRQWSEQYYSPVAMAERLLVLVSNVSKRQH